MREVVAWHFERVSVVGVPATLAATPLVSLALMGSLASLAVDFAWPDLATFLAGGVSVLLGALERVAEVSAAPPWASVWTTRTSVVAGVVCGGLGYWLAGGVLPCRTHPSIAVSSGS